MKRDLDLIRSILLQIEGMDSGSKRATVDSFLALCDDRDLLAWHIKMLIDAGFIEAIDISDKLGTNYIISCMTFSGCDYLDAIRSESIWQETRAKLQQFGGQVSLDVVKQLASALIKQQLGF
ncbi:DUF2513 domain-containing protein [Mitsuokella multacida]|uniref:DUF2513 domain-containing protein n=1 Tax=Mitsuokella multacida TaxID=52226 RepID=UPI002665F24C|nr:DUF2513 domain-containing protein [Mitsuokella multacida]